MILVVEGDHVDSTTVGEVFPTHSVYGATSVADAREWCTSGDPDVVVLGCDLDHVADFVHALRNRTLLDTQVPIVAVVEDSTTDPGEFGIDEVLRPPITAERIQETIEGAMLLGEYKRAVDEFFNRCEQQASKDLDTIFAEDPVSDARTRADETLDELREKNGIPFDQLIKDA